jgi:hypothetical protein
MPAYTCPKGHTSGTGDFCDTCGTKIGGTGPIPSPSGPDAAAGSGSGPASGSGLPWGAGADPHSGLPAGAGGTGSGPAGAAGAGVGSGSGSASGGAPSASPSGPQDAEICPHCGTPRTGNWRFCEDCGFDHTTGKVPAMEPPPAARPAGRWTATVGPDRAYFEANAIDGVAFPADARAREVDLPAPQVRIGRRSRSQGTDPEIDLSAAPADPGVSHNHALLTLNIDGVWLVSDLGSTNGTYVNDDPRPLTAGQSRSLGDGDRVHVGAWTTITLHAPTQGT